MRIFLNGDAREIATAQTISALVTELGLPAAALLVEQNGLALHREEWNAELRHGDRVEIIRIVAGG